MSKIVILKFGVSHKVSNEVRREIPPGQRERFGLDTLYLIKSLQFLYALSMEYSI